MFFCLAPLRQIRDLRRRLRQQQPRRPRVGKRLDRSLHRHEPLRPIKPQRARMIECAGMQPDPLHPLRPGPRASLGHQPPAVALPRQLRDQPEIRNLARARLAEIELEYPDLDPRRIEHRIHRDPRIMHDRRQRIIHHHQPREPQPWAPHPPEQRAILPQRRPLPLHQPQPRSGARPQRWPLAHFQRRDDRRKDVVGNRDQRHLVRTTSRAAAGSSGSRRCCHPSLARTASRGHRRG